MCSFSMEFFTFGIADAHIEKFFVHHVLFICMGCHQLLWVGIVVFSCYMVFFRLLLDTACVVVI